MDKGVKGDKEMHPIDSVNDDLNDAGDDEPDAFYDCHDEVLDGSLQSVARNLYGHIEDGLGHCDDHDTEHDIRDSGQWEHVTMSRMVMTYFMSRKSHGVT